MYSVQSFDEPSETRQFDHGRLDVMNVPWGTFMRATFEPGWRWSKDIKPTAGTESCQVHHMDYVISGTMKVQLDDGTTFTYSAGDLVDIPPGHDGWVEGDETYVAISLIGTGSETKFGAPTRRM